MNRRGRLRITELAEHIAEFAAGEQPLKVRKMIKRTAEDTLLKS